jgi:DNA-binding LacI/PurR family transcriptional regulator
VTMDEIARLFGVTRQRVSALLRESPGDRSGVSAPSTGRAE